MLVSLIVIIMAAEPGNRSVPFPSCKGKNRDPQNGNPGLSGHFQCSVQSQRDSCNGAHAWERCGMERNHL